VPCGGSAARMEGSIDEVTLGVSCGRRREGGEGEPLSLSLSLSPSLPPLHERVGVQIIHSFAFSRTVEEAPDTSNMMYFPSPRILSPVNLIPNLPYPNVFDTHTQQGKLISTLIRQH
jgi:hypothetical protein